MDTARGTAVGTSAGEKVLDFDGETGIAAEG